jgi:hypothetical protein
MMSSVSVNPLREVCPWLAVIGILFLSACSTIQSPPTAQSVAGLTPVGTVTLTETVAGGATGGTGTLTFQGRSYPFTLVGSVIGLGGASQVHAVGEIYKLNRLADFEGLYAEGTGQTGIATSGKADLWMQNKAGVIMHLKGASEGVVLTLGSNEVLLTLAK